MRKKQKKEIDQTTHFNIVIIGAGQTGMTLAKILMKYNANVLVIDKQEPGIKSSLDVKLFSFLTNKYKGIETKRFYSIFNSEMEQARLEANKPFDESMFEGSSVRFIRGTPKILSKDFVEVNGEKFGFKKLVFATGSKYPELSLRGITQEMYINPSQLSTLDSSVETVAIYGTNWVALELGQALTKIGTKVYFVDSNISPFDDFDDEVEATLKKEFKNNLMSWCLESEIIDHEKTSDNTIRITLKTDSIERSIEVNKIISTKRVPNSDSIECPFELYKNRSGAFIVSSSLKMKEHENFYAIGDVNGLHLYPHQGYYQASLLSQSFIGMSTKLDLYNFGFSLNVEPSISFYGMNKNQIEHLQIPYNEFIYDFENDFKIKLKGQNGRIKVFTNKKHEILGALLIGYETSEIINLLVLANQNKIKFHKLAWLNIPFFSKSEFIRNAAIEYYYEFVLDEKKIKAKATKIK